MRLVPTVLAGAVALAAGSLAVAHGQESDGADPGSRTARADAYLTATAQELSGTPYRVDTINLEHTLDGRQVFALEGPNTRCILVAGSDQPAGKSELLGCQPGGDQKPLSVGIGMRAGEGSTQLVWTGPGVDEASARADDGTSITTKIGRSILAVTRTDAPAVGTVSWSAQRSAARSFTFMSAQELEARRRQADSVPDTP